MGRPVELVVKVHTQISDSPLILQLSSLKLDTWDPGDLSYPLDDCKLVFIMAESSEFDSAQSSVFFIMGLAVLVKMYLAESLMSTQMSSANA